MKTLKYIHLDEQKMGTIVESLQKLLANFQIYYTNIRGFHWNITGHQFFRLHEKFEELYLDASEKADDIAERILALSGSPKNSFNDYLQVSKIEDISGVSCAEEAVKILLENISLLISLEKEILEQSNDAADDSTASMMSDYIREQEKLVWMLVAYFSDTCTVSGATK
ncbi:MAG: Dps family protein [Rikenellaceae bacterium]